MSAHTAKQIVRRANPPEVERYNYRQHIHSLSTWLAAKESGHTPSPRSARNTKQIP